MAFSSLLIGEPGSGKTTVICTAPSPVGVIDYDNKLHKMVNVVDKLKSGKVIQLAINEPLSQIGLRRLATDKTESGGTRSQAQPTGYIKFVEMIETLEKTGGIWNGVQLKSLALDSYTTMIEHLKRLLMAANSKATMTLPLYGVLLSNLEEINNTLLRLPLNIIIACHQKPEKDELTGKISILPLIEGQMGSKIGKDFEEVYYMEKIVQQGKATYQMLTVGDSTRACRTSRNLPPIVEPDFCKIYGIKE